MSEALKALNNIRTLRAHARETDLATLDKARDRGDLSQPTYWSELQRRGVLSDEFDAQEEKKRLLEEPDQFGTGGTDNPPPPVNA